MTDPIYRDCETILDAMESDERSEWVDELLAILTLPELYPDTSPDGAPW